MQNHYAVKHFGITIYDFHADNDKQAKKIANNRFGDYEQLICFLPNTIRVVG